MSDERCASTIKFLQAFMRDMYDWDTKYYDLLVKNHEVHKLEAAQQILEIYGKYLTKKERKFGREVAVNASSPPEYNPDTEVVEKCEELDAKKLLIYTRQLSGFKFACRYTVKFVGNEWKLDKRERFSAGKNKWITETF